MVILSFNFGHDGSACLLSDGKVLAAIASERVTRRKKQRGVTIEVVEYLLKKAKMGFDDISLVTAVNWFSDCDPMTGNDLSDKYLNGFFLRYQGRDLTREEYADRRENFFGDLKMNIYGHWFDCILVDHHFAHCCYAFFMSPYKDAITLSIDFNDNFGTDHSIGYFDSNHNYIRIRHGGDFVVGSLYGCICDYLGFYPSLIDAGKVMGLAAYGTPHPDFKRLSWGLEAQSLTRDPYLSLLLAFGIKEVPDRRILYPQLKGEKGVPDDRWLNKADWDEELNRNIAATVQAILEESVCNLVKAIAEETKDLSRNLCLSGGTMLNCVCNGKILDLGLFDSIYAAPACGDEGLSMGAALGVAHLLHRKDKYYPSVLETFEGGFTYTDAQILSAILKHVDEIRFLRMSEDDLIDSAINAIIDGKILAWFEGGSEIGPRALGHRSIIVDPRRGDMKDILNARVKHREPFRPFAPAVLAEMAGEWFDIKESPYMLFSVRCLKPELIPATSHVDGSARVQTVDAENNGRYYKLIKEFYRQTEVPVLLNTSFNDNGEPIVETPANAVACFLKTEIDAMVIGDFYLEKKQRSE